MRTLLLLALGAVVGSLVGIAIAEWDRYHRPPAPRTIDCNGGSLVEMEWNDNRLRRDEVGREEAAE